MQEICHIDALEGVGPYEVLKLGWEAWEEGEEGADGVGVGCETEEDKPLIHLPRALLGKT